MTEWQEVAAWSWVVMDGGRVLHHLAALDDPARTEADWFGDGRTSCGRQGQLFIPGIFARMGMDRCARCCRNVGYPKGIGSPKNDKRLYALVKREEQRA